jgi:hypothetical protein
LEHFHGGELKRWAKVQALFLRTTSRNHIMSLVDCLALWNEFKVNNTLDIEESDEHFLHL